MGCVSWTKNTALCGSGDGALVVWLVTRGTQARTLKGHTGAITASDVDWPTMRALTGSKDTSVRLWDVKQGTCLQILAQHEHSVLALSVDWSAGLMLSCAAAGAMLLWNLIENAERPQEIRLPRFDAFDEPVRVGVIA